MRNVLFFSLVAACTLPAWVSAQTANAPSDPGDPPVRFDDNRTPTYAQVNAVLSELAHAHAELHWMAIGYGDSGKPIYAAVLASGSGSKLTSPEDLAAFLAAHPKHMRLL